MVAAYQSLRDELVEEIDEEFAEEVTIFPMKAGRTDPGRPVVTIVAVLRTGKEERGNLSGGRSEQWNASVSAAGAELRVSRGRYPEVRLVRGDKIEAVDRPGKPLFEVQSVSDRSHVRLIAQLGEA